MRDQALLLSPPTRTWTCDARYLRRLKSLGIRSVSYRYQAPIAVRDGASGKRSGPRLWASEEPRTVRLDHYAGREGSGSGFWRHTPTEKELDERLGELWGDLLVSSVIEPELDAWVSRIWEDNVMGKELGFGPIPLTDPCRKRPVHRHWTTLLHSNDKPLRPKEALEALMIEISEPRSSALYQRITLQKSALVRCANPAFNRS